MPLPEEIPLDTNHPAVREYLLLVRLQVLTPLSLLINIATFMVATFIVSPGLSTISKLHPTPISPSPTFVGVYVVAIFAGQIGYCLLLVLASKEETKQALVKGVGFSLVIANWLMAFWAMTWALKLFLPSTILLILLTLALLYSNIVLLIYHPPRRSRPFDTLLIHAPMRLFLLLPATLLLPQSIFIMLNKTWDPKDASRHYMDYQWEGFAVVIVTNVVSLLIIALRRDIVWCIGAVWINICIWTARPKSTPVQATAIVFTILQPVTLVAAAVWQTLRSKPDQGGAIALPPDDEQNEAQSRRSEHGQHVERVWS
ncbi:hypothetical protein JB92DRAFT_2935233 [Gautieria morchelliformis]|nr:hypothetical protein JB92DRAFT_2935233 [Gautieria morchelliformis]